MDKPSQNYVLTFSFATWWVGLLWDLRNLKLGPTLTRKLCYRKDDRAMRAI